MEKEKTIKIVKRCPACNWRIFDKVTPTTGVIEIKCPNCRKTVTIDLSLRRPVKYRIAKHVNG